MKTTLAIVVLSLFLVSCASTQPFGPAGPDPQGPSGWAEATVKEFSMEMSQFSFSPSTITVKKGDKVRLTLTSKDVSHGFMILELGVSSGPVAKGQTKIIEFIANNVGTFEFRCSVVCGAGHKDMKGTLIVEE